ncbi:hypothetical protein SGL43_05741 [Streptomyces globisporus]|uniref:Uncharacterized protein n=1 Tax=Streptomyces globisporus TaxID=1908 RepID=A0ABN8VA24_STRGL|nr:hypothetical protein SGL43_05741 [Streptomyces globisporus]
MSTGVQDDALPRPGHRACAPAPSGGGLCPWGPRRSGCRPCIQKGTSLIEGRALRAGTGQGQDRSLRRQAGTGRRHPHEGVGDGPAGGGPLGGSAAPRPPGHRG